MSRSPVARVQGKGFLKQIVMFRRLAGTNIDQNSPQNRQYRGGLLPAIGWGLTAAFKHWGLPPDVPVRFHFRQVMYRGTSLMTKHPHLGPYSRTTPRVLGGF